MNVQHWGVDIRVNGERVLTIESSCLSGIDDIAKFREVIQGCAHHLLAFIGDGKPDDTWELGTSPNNARDEIAASVTDLVAYLDGGASVRPDDDWHKRLRQLSPVA